MHKICKYMHLPHEFTSIAYICQNMQKICKICKQEIYMHNMHDYVVYYIQVDFPICYITWHITCYITHSICYIPPLLYNI